MFDVLPPADFARLEFTPPIVIDCSTQLPQLKMVRNVPLEAYLWGQLPPGPLVSIVGTRRPTAAGQCAAFELAKQLAERGICVVSGGALGIDSAAHRGALAGNGATLVVAPTWLQVAYPTENRQLFNQIISSGGGYLTVAEQEQRPLNPAFFYRNEVLAALSEAMVLGDCPVRSGARNAMHHARRMSKPRFCLPAVFGEKTSVGNWMESQELGALSIVNVEPILRALKTAGETVNDASWLFVESEATPKKRARRAAKMARGSIASGIHEPSTRLKRSVELPKGASEEMLLVARVVSSGCSTPDAIAENSGLPIATVQHQILLLTLEGLVFQDDSGVLRYHAPDYE